MSIHIIGLVKTKMEDKLKKQKQLGSEVKDPITVSVFLMEGDFKSEDEDMSFELLSVIVMQPSQ